MRNFNFKIVQSNFGKSLQVLPLILMYLLTFNEGLNCNNYSNELEFCKITQIQQESKNTLSNSFDSHKVSNTHQESQKDNYYALESDANEEEVESNEECEVEKYNHIQNLESVSQILHIYSNQLSKRKQIPLFILHSSWKSFIN